jgi:ubiquinone/menaquinone biosynthesis C-methylase UbiE
MFNQLLKIRNRKDIISDKERYDLIYNEIKSMATDELLKVSGLNSISEFNKAAFSKYYSEIQKVLTNSNQIVLELGAGFGRHTSVIVNCDVKLIVLDISAVALDINEKIHKNLHGTLNSSIDNIPLPDQSIDVVISCESLSYADPERVNNEILRVLKPGGSLIVIDALNHNPIYKLNRVLKILLGTRSFNSVFRIPNMKRIKELKSSFERSEVYFFGKWNWFLMPLTKIFPKIASELIIQKIDRFGPNCLAFKFVLICDFYIPGTNYSNKVSE